MRQDFLLFVGWIIFYCIHWYVPHFIHSSVDGHLGCFHLLAIVNKDALNTGLQISLWVPGFSAFGCIQKVKFLDHMIIPPLIFWATIIMFSIVAVPFYIPTSSIQGFQFFHILTFIFWVSLVIIKEMQITTTPRYHFSPIRLAKIKTSDSAQRWRGDRALTLLVRMEIGHTVQKVIWQHPPKWQIPMIFKRQ